MISPAQRDALWEFVVQSLGDAIDPDFVVWSNHDHPKAGPRWCRISLLAAPSLGNSERVDFELRSLHRVEFSADVASTITIETLDDELPAIVSSAGPSSATNPDPRALRDLHLANLVGSPSWVASSADPAALHIEATEAARGKLIQVTATPTGTPPPAPPLLVRLLRDCYAEGVRDLIEPTISIQVYSRLDDENPSHEQAADVLLERVRARFFTSIAAAGLRAAGLAPVRRGSVQDLSAVAGGSQQETRAALDVTLRRSSVILEQPGSIRSVSGTGTLQPGNLTVPFDAAK